MKIKHHVSNHYCTDCGRWHSQCDDCGWFWYGACSFGEALRRIRLHQLDRTYFEARPSMMPAFPQTTAA